MPQVKCRRCKWHITEQVFEADGLVYDVAAALDIIKAAPRRPITLPPGHLYDQLIRHAINEKHLAHVNIRFPVIAIPYKDSFLVIDGNHRAWKRLFRKLPVKAYLLTLEEVERIRT